MSKKYRSDAMAAIHETMEALHDVGAIDKQTMRRFDDQGDPGEGARQPNRFRQLPERNQQSGQQVGARREAPFRGIAQAAIAGREEWARHRCIVASAIPLAGQTALGIVLRKRGIA